MCWFLLYYISPMKRFLHLSLLALFSFTTWSCEKPLSPEQRKAQDVKARVAVITGYVSAGKPDDLRRVLAEPLYREVINEREDSQTPLTRALWHLNGRLGLNTSKAEGVEIVRILLENGADPNIPNASGQMPLDLAHDTYDEQIIEMLKKAGARRAAGR
jgi:hypothetical protein